MLISFENVAFGYGENLIFSNVSFSINEGERAGLIGANGEGKTTLLRLALDELSPDGGDIVRKNGIRIGYLAQNGGYSSGNTVYEEMKEVLKEDFSAVERLAELSLKLAAAKEGSRDYSVISEKIESLNKFISARNSYNADVTIKTVLNGMSFKDCYGQVIDTMSGGEKTRLKLARLLLESPDLLILDEPTNHLDISTLFWLEDYLQTFRGALIVVSHDRYFLDRICARILELENGKLNTFTGNYSKYKVLKEEQTARLLKEYEACIEERAKLQDFVDRNIVRATTAKSAQSRVKQLEKLTLPEKPYVPPKPPAFRFVYSQQPYENVLTIKNLELRAGGKELINGGEMTVRRGDKIAVVGENGTGKTTLLKAIFGGNPQIERGRNVKIALFDQEGLNLNPENTVLAELWERHVGASQTEIRAMLARSGLFGEDMPKKVGSLSGGERAKLALCILQSDNANFLLLDEPTNHLDLPARESLEKALKEFDGTLVFVSHDRYFIAALADKIVELEKGKLNTYAGNYENFNKTKAALREALRREEERARYDGYEAKKIEGYRSKKERAEEARKKEKIKFIEAEISKLEGEEAQINSELADPAVISDYKKVQMLSDKLYRIKNELEDLYSEYADMI